jgi:hypothetical protein
LLRAVAFPLPLELLPVPPLQLAEVTVTLRADAKFLLSVE